MLDKNPTNIELALVLAGCYNPSRNIDFINFLIHGRVPDGFVSDFLSNRERVATFIGQLAHESNGFMRLEENLNYRPSTMLRVFPKYIKSKAQANRLSGDRVEFANTVYGGRMGNLPNEGYMYRGRCPIMLTGRNNYAKYGDLLQIDLLSKPDLALDMKTGLCISLMYFIQAGTRRQNLLQLSDSLSTKKVTRCINGGYHGLEDRTRRTQLALGALEDISAVADYASDKELSKAIQYYMKKCNRYSGKIDGIIGRKSRAALEDMGIGTRVGAHTLLQIVDCCGEIE